MRIAPLAYLASIFFAFIALLADFTVDASTPMLILTGVAFMLSILLLTPFFTAGRVGARFGVYIGGLILLLVVGGALFYNVDIDPADYTGGVIVFLSGVCALLGGLVARSYPKTTIVSSKAEDFKGPPANQEETAPIQGSLSNQELRELIAEAEKKRKEKEIIREKQVIVKVRCEYCRQAFDETLDKCPNCGASH
ncbi:MAG TPA: hypothetical protein V6C97_00290 [Oculatellaceae cyanobacterium]